VSVSATITIEQFDSVSYDGSVRNTPVQKSSDLNIRDSNSSATSDLIFTFLPHVTQPVSRPASKGGWTTVSGERWSDSPINQPELLYRHRFAFGRDRAEAFSTGHTPDIILTPPGSDGKRWGNLDDNSSVLMYERDFPVSSHGFVRQFKASWSSKIRDFEFNTESERNISHLGSLEADTTIEQFPFVLLASPIPFSTKNPVDTDVYIRLSNYAHTISSGTISMYFDDIVQTPLQVVEFFGGLGGFDVTWINTSDFDYDATVNVRVEFFDTDSPANKVTIRYPFYTIQDLAPPRAINIVPSDGTEDVTPLGTLQFELVDYETGVDLSTLKLYVNNILVENGIHGTVTSTARQDGKGYVVSYTTFEPWLYGDVIPVSIFVKDSSPSSNELFHSYSFTVLESTSPRMLNLNPAACAEDVPTNTSISVDVIDGGHGLDKDSVSLSVDDIERSDEATVIPIVHRDE
jgi:hypothetical protein